MNSSTVSPLDRDSLGATLPGRAGLTSHGHWRDPLCLALLLIIWAAVWIPRLSGPIRPAVSPPIEPDPARARVLGESIPVSYVIVDELGFVDVTRRYALPPVESDPAGWQLALSVSKGTQVYERSGVSKQ